MAALDPMVDSGDGGGAGPGARGVLAWTVRAARRLGRAGPWSRGLLEWLSRSHGRTVAAAAGVFVALSLIALFFLLLIERQNDSRRQQALDLHVGELAEMIRTRIDSYISILEVMGDAPAHGFADEPAEFLRAADAIRQKLPPVLAINLIDADRFIRLVSPLDPNRPALNRRVGQSPEVVALIDDAVASRQPRLTRRVTFFQGGQGIAVYIPMFDDSRLAGFVNAVFRIDDLAKDIARQIGIQRFTIRLTDGSQPLFESQREPGPLDYHAARELPIYNQTWMLSMRASRAQLDLAVPTGPSLLVLPIELLAAVLAIAIYLLLRHQHRLRLTEAAVVAADRAKSAFLANMSHELRTPLNAILGFGQMIEQGIGGTERTTGYAQRIVVAGTHLLAVISDILDISKVEAGRLELNLGQVDLRAVVEACLGIVAGTAQERGVRVAATLPVLPAIRADEVRMKQILLNLLSNAVKFTPPGGRVGVSALMRSGAISLAIEDTGVGMTASEVTLALQPFRQVGPLTIRRHEGAGLGLPLAKRLVEMHGGTLVIDSVPGRGTLVTVMLPVTGPAEPAA